MNNSDVVVGWVGFSLALVIGYGAYKNKPVFGPNGIVTTAVQTGKVGGATAPPTPNRSVYVPGRGLVDPAPPSAAPLSNMLGGVLGGSPITPGGLSNSLKGLFGGTPTPIASPGQGMYV